MTSTVALWGSILIGGCAQVLLRRGLVGEAAESSAREVGWWLRLLRSGWIWAWGVSFVVATALWLLAVSQVRISYAFPLLSAGYIFVAVLSRLLLGESIGFRRWAAIGVICVGVILIASN